MFYGIRGAKFSTILARPYWQTYETIKLVLTDYLHRKWSTIPKAGWSWGCVSTINSSGKTIFVAAAHRGDGKRFVVRADVKLTAFLELESAIRACCEWV